MTWWVPFGAVPFALFSAGSAVMAQQPAAPVGNPAEWFAPDNYPLEAIRARQEGRVVAAASIDAMGKPIACRIAVSSGFPSLDAGTCAIIMARAFYNPARDRRGRTIPSEVKLPVRWVLPVDGVAPQELDLDHVAANTMTFRAETRVVVAADGTVSSCTVDPPNIIGFDAGGPCSMYPIGKKVLPIARRHGQAVGAQIISRFETETIFDR